MVCWLGKWIEDGERLQRLSRAEFNLCRPFEHLTSASLLNRLLKLLRESGFSSSLVAPQEASREANLAPIGQQSQQFEKLGASQATLLSTSRKVSWTVHCWPAELEWRKSRLGFSFSLLLFFSSSFPQLKLNQTADRSHLKESDERRTKWSFLLKERLLSGFLLLVPTVQLTLYFILWLAKRRDFAITPSLVCLFYFIFYLALAKYSERMLCTLFAHWAWIRVASVEVAARSKRRQWERNRANWIHLVIIMQLWILTSWLAKPVNSKLLRPDR